MATISAKPITGFITFMMPSSFSCDIMLANTVEKAMPISIKFSTGVGSMLFDFTNPMYIAESWITFLTKFAIGFLAGLISWGGLKQKAAAVHTMGRDIAGAVVGVLAYVALYMGKSFIVMYYIERQTLGAVQVQMLTKLASSMVNAVAGAIVAVLLAKALRPALHRAGLFAREM